jgi:hypothetical protein
MLNKKEAGLKNREINREEERMSERAEEQN